MSQPLKSKYLALEKMRCQIFGTNFNPDNVRTGAKVLRRRLIGPTSANYYNRTDLIGLPQIKKLFSHFHFVDLSEQYRVTMVAARKRRGKGAPTKKKEATEKRKK